MKALLDTHVLVGWLNDPNSLSDAQRRVVDAADAASPLLVADISLWEVATLHSLGRVRIRGSLRRWLEKAVAPPLVKLQGITPAIAAEVAALPDTFHRDPADRILVATARVMDAVLLTRDQRIIKAGLVQTLR